jgi:hypothetical protein
MVRCIFHAFILVTLAVSCGCGGGGGGGGTVQPSVCVEFTAASAPAAGLVVARSATQSTCDVLVLDVVVTDVTDVFAADLEVGYDNAVLRYDGHVDTASFLGSDGAVVETIGPQSDATGSFTVGITRVNVTTGIDVTTPAVLIQLRFRRVAQSGSGSVSFPDGSLLGSEEPPVEKPGLTWRGGTATVR